MFNVCIKPLLDGAPGVTFVKVVLKWDVPAETQKFDFLYINFLPSYPPNTLIKLNVGFREHKLC